jgi:hypothetical protein
MLRGVNILANAVKVTLGPKGRNAVLEKSFGAPTVTKDGVSVAKEIELKDKFENMGAQMVKEVASNTSDEAGDGTTTATVLAQAIVREGLKAVAAGANPMDIKRGIDKAVETATDELKKLSKPADRKFKALLRRSLLGRTSLMTEPRLSPPAQDPPIGRPDRQPNGRLAPESPASPGFAPANRPRLAPTAIPARTAPARPVHRSAQTPLTFGSSMLAMTLSFPPQRAQSSISMPNTRFSRRAQLIATCLGVGRWTESVTGPVRCGAPMPRCAGVTATRLAIRSSGSITRCVVPSRYGVLS